MVRIAGLTLVTPDAARLTAFYVDALGFAWAGGEDHETRLTLGDTKLRLLQPAHPGLPYPPARAANDPWFQHFAIAVGDMDRAFARLAAHPHEAISRGSPQALPPSTGNVVAYKFRDPDGHPLELSFVPGKARPDDPLLVRIDHSAIAVADIRAAEAFYEMLGFRVAERLVNTGPAQDRLDGLTDVILDISVLVSADGPHLELLHYRRPASSMVPRRWAENDIPATRLRLDEEAVARLSVDPDGHWLEFARGIGVAPDNR